MDKNKFIKDNFGISDKTLKLVSEAEQSIKEQFKHIENICEINQLRVMKAFADNRVSDSLLLRQATVMTIWAEIRLTEYMRILWVQRTHLYVTISYLVRIPSQPHFLLF